MRDAYATFLCPVQTLSGDSRARWVTLQGLVGGCCGWKVQPKLCMGQDLDYNTVIIYFTADDLIRFSPSDPKRAEKERLSACVCVLTWAWIRVCPGHISPSRCVGVKNPGF